jgi:hypothetical protein
MAAKNLNFELAPEVVPIGSGFMLPTVSFIP